MVDHPWRDTTRCGTPVTIYRTDARDTRPGEVPLTIHGAIEMRSRSFPLAWTEGGRAFPGQIHPWDLVRAWEPEEDEEDEGGTVA